MLVKIKKRPHGAFLTLFNYILGAEVHLHAFDHISYHDL